MKDQPISALNCLPSSIKRNQIFNKKPDLATIRIYPSFLPIRQLLPEKKEGNNWVFVPNVSAETRQKRLTTPKSTETFTFNA